MIKDETTRNKMSLLEEETRESSCLIDVEEIVDFPNHPFKVVDDDKMEELVADVKARGVTTPVIVRKGDDGSYQMISGHRRVHAAKRAGISMVPAFIREYTDDEATREMVGSNLERGDWLPSERAFAYKMQMEALKHQGQRTDLTSGKNCQKSPRKTSRDELAALLGVSARKIQNDIRLTELIPELLSMVDEDDLPTTQGVTLSYLSKETQHMVYDYMHEGNKLVIGRVKTLRDKEREGIVLTEPDVREILTGEPLPEPAKRDPNWSLDEKKIGRFFPRNYTNEQMEEVITELLKWWKSNYDEQQRSRNRSR